ncbi:30S ribosomal protein S1 [Aerococcaceae bacterium zg-ZJ1578]|uniref:30S ribosomal protein S1 n=1 Tax=Aerococcaceae bacterium zg-252 TaxID=2796928 RepID=UPI001A35C0CA|nr:30S ribosomal protein S1 [Aerococcaceae bacterium zg-1578]MBR7927286.1 30S ribosomal protein S1 [Aerococcaceae bacterium zg-ZUI334]
MSEVEKTEVLETMEDALDSVIDIKIGDTVKGDVLAFDDNQVRVAIKESGGLEGVIPRNELSAAPFNELTDVVNIGDEIELVVLKPIKDKENGNYLLSKKRVESRKVWVELKEKADRGETIEAPVKDVVKGGLVVDAGVRGFVPASMVEDHFVEDFSAYKGKTLEFAIVEVDANDNRLILSHKEIAKKDREAKRAEALSNLAVDAVVEGKVARLTNFGAFIDLGGVDGLVHISRISHQHISKPSDALTIGDTVQVKVLSIDEEKGRISLSIKDTLPGPWDNITEKAAEGTELTGTVKRLTDFGAFVEVFPGVEGLVHVSQISHEHIAKPADKLSEGQEVQVKVLSTDPVEQRLSLSIKALQEKPARPEVEEGEERPNRTERFERQARQAAPRPKRNNQSARKANNNTQAATYSDSTDTGFTLGDMFGDLLDSFTTEN